MKKIICLITWMFLGSSKAIAHPFSQEEYSLRTAINVSQQGIVPLVVLEIPIPVALKEIGIRESAETHTLRLAGLAKECGLAGVVSSPLEVSLMRERLGSKFLFVTPGVRPLGTSVDDQARIATPLEAMAHGASYLVVGRPITSAPNPASALAAINEELIH